MWEEAQSAAEVVRRGTVAAAAEALGVHRVTVNRRIDALEAHLGAKLFLRHTRGYIPTDLGLDLLRIAEDAEGGLERLRVRAQSKDQELSGDLIVTSPHALAPMLLTKIEAFTASHPSVTVNFISTGSLLRLDLCEAHVALRVGAKPTQPYYVALAHEPVRIGLYASAAYVERFGKPELENLSSHRFVVPTMLKDVVFRAWLGNLVVKPLIALECNHELLADAAVKASVGVGFMPIQNAKDEPGLVEVMPPKSFWRVPSWIVTHVDLHRSAQGAVVSCASPQRHRRETIVAQRLRSARWSVYLAIGDATSLRFDRVPARGVPALACACACACACGLRPVNCRRLAA